MYKILFGGAASMLLSLWLTKFNFFSYRYQIKKAGFNEEPAFKNVYLNPPIAGFR
jgi:hypothetical protein